MSNSVVRCPACRANAKPIAGKAGRYRCLSCDEVFELLDLPGESSPRTKEGKSKGKAPAGAGNRATLIVVALLVAGTVAVGVVCAVGVAGYFMFKRAANEQEVVDNQPPAPVLNVEQPKPPAQKETETPKKEVPPAKAEEPPKPKPPTPQEIVRRVKDATVYIRTTLAPGRAGTGSGFFVGKSGYVLTNAHVVGYGPREVWPPTEIEVIVNSGEVNEQTLTAKIYGVDVESDLALLRLEVKVAGAHLPAPLQFGKAAELVETQEVMIYGYPFGELLGKNISVNRSSVSSLRKEGGKIQIVQLAGGLNPGNSGGPVTNVKGEVIGVSVAKLRGTDTIAFAIPAEDADAFVKDQYRTGGRFETGGLVVIGPARPQVKPPVGAPALRNLRPAVGLDKSDKVYVPREGPEEVKLPGHVIDVVAGGGGRFLIFRLADQKKLAVFDVWLAKVVKEIPLADDTPHFAAGTNRLVIVYRGAKLVQIWNLTTFEKDKSALLPDSLTSDDIHQVCMGSASNGPLFVYLPKEKRTLTMDLGTLKTTEVVWNHWSPSNAYGPLVMRASADGSVLAGHGGGWVGCDIAFFDKGRQVGVFDKIPFWSASNAAALPTADGRHVFASGRVLSRSLVQSEWDGGKNAYVVPAMEPGFVVSLQAVGNVGQANQAGRPPEAVAVFNEDRQKLFFLKGLDELTTDAIPWEKRVFYYPKSGALVTLDRDRDRVIMRRVNLVEELDRTDTDYLAVLSRPPAAHTGKRFEYQIEAKSKKGGIKYKLAVGPKGMTVNADGKVVWPEPLGLNRAVNVVVTVTDGGAEVIHSFELGTVTSTRDRP
jgi:S1-C subfamily serine protease